MVYEPGRSARYLDSLGRGCWGPAERIVRALDLCYGTSTQLRQVDAPQQTNGYDCGVHMLLNVERVLFEVAMSATCGGMPRHLVPEMPSPTDMRAKMRDHVARMRQG